MAGEKSHQIALKWQNVLFYRVHTPTPEQILYMLFTYKNL